MTTTKILALTLLATTLTLGAATPKEIRNTTKQRTNSISNAIATILYRRGIEEHKALELSRTIMTTNEELYSLMVLNFISHTQLPKERVLDYLSKQALYKKSTDFSSYASLIKISHSLKNEPLTENELENMQALASKNKRLERVFS